MTSSLLDLAELDIETTCSLTKLLGFDSVSPSPRTISLTRSMSEQASSRSNEGYFKSLAGIESYANNNTSNDGRYQNMQPAPSVPISRWPSDSWRSAATMVTPNGQASTGQFSDPPPVKLPAEGTRGFLYGALWRKQPEPTTLPTSVPAASDYTSTTGVFHQNHNGQYTPVESVKSEPQDYFPSANPTASPLSKTLGVNLTSQIPIQHLNNCYAYAINRGNGQYTRLIPADCLSPLAHIPKLQDASGLIILPVPRGMTPFARTGQPSSNEYAPAPSAIGAGRPSSVFSPHTTSVSKPHEQVQSQVQSTIDAIISTFPEAPKRKVKVYCDKWIHSGQCAFEQQGCRYKHEMPVDKETQFSVGLFSGLPAWYLKVHPELRGKGKGSPGEGTGGSVTSPKDITFSPRGQGRSGLFAGGPWRGGNGNANANANANANGGRGGGGMRWKNSPPTPQASYNYARGFPASRASPGFNHNHAAYANGSPPSQRWGNDHKGSAVSSPPSNPYDLLYGQEEQEEINDGEV